MKQRPLQRLWEAASLYLPVLLMGVLALGSWWLVRQAPRPGYVAPAALAPDEPDYTLHDFALRQFDATGRITGEITGDMARHYPATGTLVVEAVRTRSIGLDGSVTTSSARQGISNEDGSELRLHGDALVRRIPGPGTGGSGTKSGPAPELVLLGQSLHAWQESGQLRSNQPVMLTRESESFTADSLHYDSRQQVLVLQGRVRGVIQPQPGPRP